MTNNTQPVNAPQSLIVRATNDIEQQHIFVQHTLRNDRSAQYRFDTENV
jgi:hypothetical protein